VAPDSGVFPNLRDVKTFHLAAAIWNVAPLVPTEARPMEFTKAGTKQHERVYPAALTSYYDLVVRVVTRESVFKGALAKQAGLHRQEHTPDLGYGAGTLSIALAKMYSDATIAGLDADHEALDLARSKGNGGGQFVRTTPRLCVAWVAGTTRTRTSESLCGDTFFLCCAIAAGI